MVVRGKGLPSRGSSLNKGLKAGVCGVFRECQRAVASASGGFLKENLVPGCCGENREKVRIANRQSDREGSCFSLSLGLFWVDGVLAFMPVLIR